MNNVREIKKIKTRNDILNYARKRFLQDGYIKVKTSEIAKGANVGEGTIFNYFKSKGHLFIEALFSEINLNEYTIELSQNLNEQFVVEEITSIINFHLFKLNLIKKDFLIEFFSIIYSNEYNNKNDSVEIFQHLDKLIVLQINDLLSKIKTSSSSTKDYDVDSITEIIVSCVVMQFTLFVYNKRSSYDNLMAVLSNHIKLIIKGNIFFNC